MVWLAELLREARLATNEKGDPVVQISLKTWEDWTGIPLDTEVDKPYIIVSINCCWAEISVMYRNEYVSSAGHSGMGSIELTLALVEYLRSERSLLAGMLTATSVIEDIGAALPLEQEMTKKIRGRNLVDGLPAEVELSSTEVRQALGPVVDTIVRDLAFQIKHALPEEMRSVSPERIVLRGDFARLRGLDQRLQEVTGVPVIVK